MIRINVSKAYQSVSNRIKGVSNLILSDVHPAIMRRDDYAFQISISNRFRSSCASSPQQTTKLVSERRSVQEGVSKNSLCSLTWYSTTYVTNLLYVSYAQ